MCYTYKNLLQQKKNYAKHLIRIETYEASLIAPRREAYKIISLTQGYNKEDAIELTCNRLQGEVFINKLALAQICNSVAFSANRTRNIKKEVCEGTFLTIAPWRGVELTRLILLSKNVQKNFPDTFLTPGLYLYVNSISFVKTVRLSIILILNGYFNFILKKSLRYWTDFSLLGATFET